MTASAHPPHSPWPESGRRAVRAAIWLPGLAVALGAAVATAHGLYETAVAADVPAGIAWLYPLITDGLALVAYTATARLTGSAARYAWSVVVLAAGLSGLAQAAYLAADATVATPAWLRFGVGAWPAVAAAIVAHLLYLLAVDPDPGAPREAGDPQPSGWSTRPDLVAHTSVQSPSSTVQPDHRAPVQPDHCAALADGPALPVGVQLNTAPGAVAHRPAPDEHPAGPPAESTARGRARAAAQRYAGRHGALPTVTELEAAAEVSRGTAAAVLKALRGQPIPLHLLTRTEQDDTASPEPRTQP